MQLLQSGQALLEQVAGTLQAALAGNQVGAARTNGRGGPGALAAIRDPKTGEPYLQIRLPPPEVLTRAVDGIRAFLQGLR